MSKLFAIMKNNIKRFARKLLVLEGVELRTVCAWLILLFYSIYITTVGHGLGVKNPK